ncbi:phosphatase PAP2 family protein [bacterium]|uniref:phosphatase PAP2 family protein n=1 Tax=Lachnospiraceae TaxID=186803 RepID=UPI002A32EC52|nr:phosphatase PAP2 family protein [bacterium]MDY2884322.1 phosphatase PAP2 family protein [Bariatricus sp.]MCI7148539.1 phosphatase PAP2 family protein [bacterium]MDD6515917.1 phosphatase PAP2 family protein [bacterium]MDY4194801.1 phosphatase PAP2 family protein [Bariatricus sp.]
MKRLTINIKELFDKYHHAWVFLYGFIYMPWFSWLEKHVTSNYFVIHSVFDDYIPFIEIFIIPYLLWFVYVSGTVLYFFFTDKQGFYRICTLLITGMTLFLIICTIFPNGLNLRPSTFARDNIFVDLVRFIYRADTSTNVLPSLHVYNSIGCYIAIRNSQKLRQYKWVQNGSLVLTVSIVLSTMFLKQHSVVDVIAAIVMIYFIYQFVYIPEQVKAPALAQPTI